MRAHHKRKKQRFKKKVLVIAIIVVIAVAIAATVTVLHRSRFISIVSKKTIFLSNTPLFINVKGNYFTISLASYSSGNAVVVLDKLPIFVNPKMSISLKQGEPIHINVGTKYANLELKLNSINSTVADITLIPIDPNLGVAPDNNAIKYTSNLLLQNSPAGINIKIKNLSITTASSTTTSTSITTTIKQTNETTKAMNIAKKSIYYPLMVNYSVVYANTVNCTSNVYNESYKTYYGYSPSGSATYQNRSLIVPYKMNKTISKVGNNQYIVAYNTYSKLKVTTGRALTITVNLTSKTISNTTLSGIFMGENYTNLYKGYIKAVGIGNACGIEIV